MWQDKRQVLMLSTYHDASVQNVNRRGRGGTTVDIQKPTVIVEYTSRMGAVDRADHLCTSYNFARKSCKWWRKLFFWIIEVSVVNSFILFNASQIQRGQPKCSHLEYRKKLITELVGNVRNISKKAGRPSTRDKEERLNKQQHFPAIFDDGKCKDCAVCSKRKIPGGRKQTAYYCKTCSRHPALHPNNCFEKYHTVVDYKN
jgi:hypothetical protein